MPLAAPHLIEDQDYEFLRRLVYDHSRINLGPDRKELVSARVAKRLKTLKMDTIADYCRMLQDDGGGEELVALIDVISTNFTSFFREARHFEFIRETWLPDAAPRAAAEGRPLRVWSAACSTGEEPYSAAMLLTTALNGEGAPGWSITATDISTKVLKKAAAGIYPVDAVKLPRPEWLPRFFQYGCGQWKKHYRVKRSLRDRVAFRRLNLLEARYPFRLPFDLILCRNVMIYFDNNTQSELIHKLESQLSPEGVLIVGSSESLSQVAHDMELAGPSVYRRRAPIRHGNHS